MSLPGTSFAEVTEPEGDGCGPQMIETESDDEPVTEESGCDCLRELPPPCPEIGESDADSTGTESDSDEVIE